MTRIIAKICAVIGIAIGSSLMVGTAQAQTATEIDTSSVIEMTIGAEDAPIEMIEYASYTCPHCGKFHTDVFKKLKQNYIDTGKVRFTYREVYFDRYGLWASMVARCGGEEVQESDVLVSPTVFAAGELGGRHQPFMFTTPKLNCVYHLAETAHYLNRRRGITWTDEDVAGNVKATKASCAHGTEAHRVPET